MAGLDKKSRGRPKQSSEVPLDGIRTLDRNGVVPLYFQLASALLERLDAGVWKTGARFPSEREIAEAFDVSRTVIRPALDLLVGDGAIVRVKGSGAFIAPPRREISVFGMVEALSDLPSDISLTILMAREEPADAAVTHFLEIDGQSAPVAHVTALLDVAGQTVGLIDSHSSTTLVPWLLPTAQSLQTEVRHPKPSKVGLGRATIAIEHTFFGRWGGSRVGVSAGDPALMGRLVQYGRAKGQKAARPLEFARLIYRSDSVQLAIDLG